MKTIKKLLLSISFTLVLLSCTLMTNAQKKFEFGFRYMPTISDFEMNSSTGGTVTSEANVGYGVGALLGWNFSKHVSVQAEIIYSSISQKYSENDVEHQVNLKYINIPLLLSLNTNKYGPVNLSLVGGPQIGLNVGSEVNTTGGDGTVTSEAVISIKKSDIGVAYGLGVDFGLNEAKTFRLGLGYRGVLGLIDISDNNKSIDSDEYYIVDQAKIKTHAIYIGLSFLI
jgi:opacity protein-like surface antigen